MGSKWLRWLAPAALALAIFLTPTQGQFRRDLPQITTLKELTVRDVFVDNTPRPMVVLASDHHGCGEWPLTVVAPLTSKYRIPYTVYLNRPDDAFAGLNGCEDAEDLTSAKLQTLFAQTYFEVGVHHGGGHVGPPGGYSAGILTITSGSDTAHGTGVNWASELDVGDLMLIPQATTTPFIVLVVDDANTVTLDRTSPKTATGQRYTSYNAFDITDGITAGTDQLTCSACDFQSDLLHVKEPILGGTFGVGSIIIIDGEAANPFFVDSIDGATTITLNKAAANTASSLAVSITPWLQLHLDDVEKGKAEIEGDGNCPGCVVSAGGPSNTAWPESGYYLKSIGIESLAAKGGGFNLYGSGDPSNLNRLSAMRIQISPQGYIEMMRAGSETDGLLVLNLEQVFPGNGYRPSDNNGTVSIVSTDNTIELLGDNCPADPCWDDIRADTEVCDDSGGGATDVEEDCFLFVRACVNATDVPGTNCQLDQRTYRIASFTDDNTLEVNPTDLTNDINDTPIETVTAGVYWIDNVVTTTGSTSCRDPFGACTGTLEDNLDNFMEWLNINRSEILAMKQASAVKRFRTMGFQYNTNTNLVGNPYRRIQATNLVPPDSLGYVGSNPNVIGWRMFWGGTPDNTISLTFDQTKRQLVYTDDDSGAQLEFQQEIMFTGTPTTLSLLHLADLKDVTNIDAWSARLDVRNTMNNRTVGNSSFAMPSATGDYDGDITADSITDPTPIFMLRDTYSFANTSLMRALFDCAPETSCSGSNQAEDVIAPGPLQAASPTNAAPDPFIINVGSATAGVYTITVPPSSRGLPLYWIQSLTTAVHCTADEMTTGDRTVVVTCEDDAGTGQDTKFVLFYFDPQIGALHQNLELGLFVDITGTVRMSEVNVFPGMLRQQF